MPHVNPSEWSNRTFPNSAGRTGAGSGSIGSSPDAPAASITLEMVTRQYLPALCRFLEVDPIEGSVTNNYDYSANPINMLDLSGEQWSWDSAVIEGTDFTWNDAAHVARRAAVSSVAAAGAGAAAVCGRQRWDRVSTRRGCRLRSSLEGGPARAP
jgi:hypothetical protein